jgi:hypothetical protein
MAKISEQAERYDGKFILNLARGSSLKNRWGTQTSRSSSRVDTERARVQNS